MGSFPWDLFLVSMLMLGSIFSLSVIALVAIVFGNFKIVNATIEGLKDAIKNFTRWPR